MPQIWWRASKQAYYLQIDRKTQKRLGKTKAEAEAAYRQWLIDHGEPLPVPERKKLTVAEVAQEFLHYSKAHTKPRSYEFYCYFVVPFVERFGSAPAATFPPLSFTKWLDEHPGWQGARRSAIIAIKRMFNFAVEQKLLAENPLKSLKKPPKKRRNRVMSPEERRFVCSAIRDEQFREFVFAMLETGCRPGEVMTVTAADVARDCSVWVLDEHKTDRTGEARVVYLTPTMQELTRKLVNQYPEGPLFRSTRRFNGVRRPWSRNGIRCRFKRLREKFLAMRAELPPERRHEIPDLTGLTAYVLRHTFATQALLNGVPGPIVSSLLGHKSLKMLDTYSHVGQAADELREAAKKATRGGG
jgi:integrase